MFLPAAKSNVTLYRSVYFMVIVGRFFWLVLYIQMCCGMGFQPVFFLFCGCKQCFFRVLDYKTLRALGPRKHAKQRAAGRPAHHFQAERFFATNNFPSNSPTGWKKKISIVRVCWSEQHVGKSRKIHRSRMCVKKPWILRGSPRKFCFLKTLWMFQQLPDRKTLCSFGFA